MKGGKWDVNELQIVLFRPYITLHTLIEEIITKAFFTL